MIMIMIIFELNKRFVYTPIAVTCHHLPSLSTMILIIVMMMMIIIMIKIRIIF